jgi:hypothetical protein
MFVETMAREVCGSGRASIVDLNSAVELLYAPCPKGEARKAAMREIDEQTQGQPFRLDTPKGPLFSEFPLWYFAGRSGITHCDCAGEKCTEPDRPVWPKTARQASRRIALAA